MNAQSPGTFTKAAEPTATDDACDLCCAVPVAKVIEGDRMCQTCVDKWAGRPIDDDLVPLSRLYAMGVLPCRGFE